MNEKTDKKAAEPEPEESRLRESALMEMAKAFRGLAMYPPGHPQRSKLISQAQQGLQGVLGRLGDISFQVGRNAFICGESKLGTGQEAVRELAEDMHQRQVKSFSLRRELSVKDLTAFMEMLQQDAEKFRQGKYIEKWLTSREVSTIWVNEIDFSRMVKSSEDLEEEEQEEEEATKSLDEQIRELLGLLEEESDPDNFDRLLRELEVLVRPLLEEKQYNKAWWVVSSLLMHTDPEKRPGAAGESIRARVARSLSEMVDKPFLMHLMDRYGKSNVSEPESYLLLFQLLGKDSINAALDTMARTEAMGAYRPLTDFILSQKENSSPILISRLSMEEKPVLVRKAIYLLGVLKDRNAIEGIREMLSHPENKVRREATKALVGYRSKEASRVLISSLNSEKSFEVRLLVVQALGESKDLAAVAPLLKLLKSTPLREDTLPLMEATIETLSKIGSREALPPLIKILNKRAIFKRALNYRLRVKAAEALSTLGGENAKQALARYADPDKQGELERKCAESLETLLEKDASSS
ncbi:MAG: HEAT repeat domain-containing protein [bacterium]